MGLVVAASVIAFLTTELDNLVILVILFCSINSKVQRLSVALGSYAGLFLLVHASLVFSNNLSAIHTKEILGLFGFLPIIMGIMVGINYNRELRPSDNIIASLFVFLITFIATVIVVSSNGGANIAVYTSFFSSLNRKEFIVLCMIFFFMQTIWIFCALVIVNVKSIREYVQKTRTVLIPFLLILLGLYLLLSSGTFIWLFGK